MAPFDFAPLALRYAQDERLWDHSPVRPEPFDKLRTGVAERQRSEVEGCHVDDGQSSGFP